MAASLIKALSKADKGGSPWTLKTKPDWSASRYSAATTASPIAAVPTLVVPSDQMSAVRSP